MRNGTNIFFCGYGRMRLDPNQQLTVLLIDDESLIRMATAAMLEDAGYRVVEAGSAEQALATLAANTDIEIIVTDVQMPGNIDGLALVEILSRRFPTIKAIVTSGRTSCREACEHGAKWFLPKPYSADAIQSAVAAVMSTS